MLNDLCCSNKCIIAKNWRSLTRNKQGGGGGGGPVLTPNFCLAHDMQHFSNHVILHTTLVTLHRFQ